MEASTQSDTNTRVDTGSSGIALMKQEEEVLQTYFNEVFCRRDFERLSEFLDHDYLAFTGPETLVTEGKAIRGAETIKPLLLKFTAALEGKQSSVSGFLSFPLEDEDKALAVEFCKWKIEEEGEESGFKFPMMDFVCDWLCKCNIELSTGQAYHKLWMFSPKSGKLCCSWNYPDLNKPE